MPKIKKRPTKIVVVPDQYTRYTRCKGCDRPIMWVTTQKGRKMPLETVEVTVDARAEPNRHLYTKSGVVVSSGWDWRYGYDSHWARCPQADSFRRIGGGHDTPFVASVEGPESHDVG